MRSYPSNVLLAPPQRRAESSRRRRVPHGPWHSWLSWCATLTPLIFFYTMDGSSGYIEHFDDDDFAPFAAPSCQNDYPPFPDGILDDERVRPPFSDAVQDDSCPPFPDAAEDQLSHPEAKRQRVEVELSDSPEQAKKRRTPSGSPRSFRSGGDGGRRASPAPCPWR